MSLEDHIGDVVRKGRMMAGVDAGKAAAAAGISAAQLAELEDTGLPPGNTNFHALGQAIGLNGKKLKHIALGWLPATRDLSTWRELRMLTTNGGGMSVNAYLIWDEVSREAALFDTGWTAKPILELLRHEQLQLRHIFITHSHHDHIACLDDIRAAAPKARLHTSSKTAPIEHRNRATDFIHLGSLRITNRDTPGHAEDGTTYVIGTWPDDAPHVAIVGDAIFAGSIGRGNISWETARQKVREQILELPPETLLCPGHGPVSTVAEERAHNPFF